MSVKVMGQVWELDLPTGQKMVLLALADHADHDGTRAYPGVARIAWMTGISPRAVQAHLRALEAAEIIEVRAYAKGGRGRSTDYDLHPVKGATLAPFTPSRRSPKGATDAPKGATVAPQPSLTVLKEVDTSEQVSTSAERPFRVACGEDPLAEPLSPGWEESQTTPGLYYQVGPDGKHQARRDLLWESIVYVAGWDPATITKTARQEANGAAGEIRAVGGRPEDVAVRARRYFARYGERPTPSALKKHWPALHSDETALRLPRRILEKAGEQALRQAHRTREATT